MEVIDNTQNTANEEGLRLVEQEPEVKPSLVELVQYLKKWREQFRERLLVSEFRDNRDAFGGLEEDEALFYDRLEFISEKIEHLLRFGINKRDLFSRMEKIHPATRLIAVPEEIISEMLEDLLFDGSEGPEFEAQVALLKDLCKDTAKQMRVVQKYIRDAIIDPYAFLQREVF